MPEGHRNEGERGNDRKYSRELHAHPVLRHLTPALSCTADWVQNQCAAAFSAEPGPPSRQAESRVSLNAWLAAVDTIDPIVWVPVVVHDGDDKDRSVLD